MSTADPWETLKPLLEHAKHGDEHLLAIRGYTSVSEIGKGGMGAVYLARHDETGESVAIKVMLPRMAADDRAVDLFLRETENTRALNHPHVVQVRGAGFAHGVFFLTLEYCDGGSVAQRMHNRGGKLPVDEATEIILQALEGLEYAHNAEIPYVKLARGGFMPGRGLVHRDIKPSNILLSGSGSGRIAKVADFGLAKAFDKAGLSGQTMTGDLCGTIQYMSRQQLRDAKRAKPEVDVWSIAATFYHMLTGSLARDFPAGADPCLIILEQPAVPILHRMVALPDKLAEVIDTALIEDPRIVFSTAAAFKQALEDAL